MMFKAVPSVSSRPKGDLIVIPCFKGKKGAQAATLPADLKSEITPILESGDFSAKLGSTQLAYLSEKKEKRCILLGLGDELSCDPESIRRAYGALIKRCQDKKWKAINVPMPSVKGIQADVIATAMMEGIGLCLYLYEKWKSKDNQSTFHTDSIHIIGKCDSKMISKVEATLSGVNFARDLVNGNAMDITPQGLAREAKKLAAELKSVKVTVRNRAFLEKEKMGLFLAVAAGSDVDPALIEFSYRGNPRSKDLTMVVGKGVTFDTGGLNLKPTNFIEDMRSDMGGGAAVFGLIRAAALMKLKVNIVGLIPATENAIGSKSYKPGDVFRAYSGKSVEITNTDAEGRLILADALAYGQKTYSPSRVIDLATLTGAIVVALGEEYAGFYSNDEDLAKLCTKAGEVTGERVWRMPIHSDYKRYMKSDIADLKNASKVRAAGSITAAIFLQEFIESKMPWIHLDIAGTAFLDKPRDYHQTLATGMGVRLLIDLLSRLK